MRYEGRRKYQAVKYSYIGNKMVVGQILFMVNAKHCLRYSTRGGFVFHLYAT